MPPVRTPAASALAAAINASTTSTSIRVKPGARRRAAAMALLVLDVRVDAAAAGLSVRAEADQVERLAFAGCVVDECVSPRILELGRLRIGPEPAGGVAGLGDQVVQRVGQAAGVVFVLLHFLGQRLHLRLGEVELRAVAAAEDAARGEGDDAADQHQHEDDLDEAETGLR